MSNDDYRFFKEGKEKDPMIAQLQTILQRKGNLSPAQIRLLSDKSGVGYGTIWGWFYGPTRNPHVVTMRFVAEAAGARIGLIMDDGTVVRNTKGKKKNA